MKQVDINITQQVVKVDISVASAASGGRVTKEVIIEKLEYTPEDESNKVTAFSETPSDDKYPSEKLVADLFKQLAPAIAIDSSGYEWNAEGTEATITVSASGGLGGLTYTLGAESNITGVFVVTTAGTYTVVVSDGLGNMESVDVEPATGFITKWQVSGDSDGRTITLPLTENGEYNATVYWGDGETSEINSYNDVNRIHTYADDGEYDVMIEGECPGWSFNNEGDCLKIKEIVNWGNPSLFGGFSYIENGFFGCINLTVIGSGKIQSKNDLTSLYNLFRDCVGITEIPSGLFDNCINVTSFRAAFENTNIISIPDGLFDNNLNVTLFQHTFYNCSELINVPAALFKSEAGGNYKFEFTFRNCIKLKSVPADVFIGGIKETSTEFAFNRTFMGSGLEEIPAGLFDNCEGIIGRGWSLTFHGTPITSIPAGLFDNCPNVELHAFHGTFEGMTQLQSIPAGLFDNATIASDFAFRHTFLECINLKTIPLGLFDNNPLVGDSGFDGTFRNCYELEEVPEGLFRNNINVGGIGFNRVFSNCRKLKLNKYIFYNEGEQATRFLNRVSDFTEAFKIDNPNVAGGTAPDLWECDFGTETPVTTDCFENHSLITLLNYADIPLEWGGSDVDMTPMIIEVNTENAGTSEDNEFRLTGAEGSYFVEYDGKTEIAQNDYLFQFETSGIKEIKISGGLQFIKFNNTGDKLKISEIKQWGGIQWTSMFRAFYGCSNLNIIATDTPDFTLCADFRFTFQNCFNLVGNNSIGEWDLSNATLIQSTFLDSGLNQSLADWKLRIMGTSLFRCIRRCGMSEENYSRTLIGFANYVHANSGPFNVDMRDMNDMIYNNIDYVADKVFTNAVDARAYLVETVANGGAEWNITADSLAV